MKVIGIKYNVKDNCKANASKIQLVKAKSIKYKLEKQSTIVKIISIQNKENCKDNFIKIKDKG